MCVEVGYPDNFLTLIDKGITVDVHVGHPSAPVQDLHNYKALIDTGSRECCIDLDLVDQLRLQQVDEWTPIGVEGKAITVPVYPGRIVLDALGVMLIEPCQAYPVRAMSRGTIDVLLGRSFLHLMQMAYNGPSGSVKLERPD